uniref:Uncharacterized protein n=1 Tax=Triticum urartu TaxID=4572 RepID=A0A8R7QKT9_TRIUA
MNPSMLTLRMVQSGSVADGNSYVAVVVPRRWRCPVVLWRRRCRVVPPRRRCGVRRLYDGCADRMTAAIQMDSGGEIRRGMRFDGRPILICGRTLFSLSTCVGGVRWIGVWVMEKKPVEKKSGESGGTIQQFV